MSIDVTVVVALITGIAGLVVALVSAYLSSREQRRTRQWQHEQREKQEQAARELAVHSYQLQRASVQEDRLLAAHEELDRFREPLLAAVRDLQHRINNIRTQNFFMYLAERNGHRSRIALLSTAYRFGVYWGVVNALYAAVNPVRFQSEQETRKVAQMLTDIGKTFADDNLDEARLMMWREEQRAIAELMVAPTGGSSTHMIGFATFAQRFDADFSMWFEIFLADMKKADITVSARLEKLESLLAELVQLLESGRPASVR
ncbi:hypothetical protein NUM3379_22680 [Kineococcus sp. NUM-3379]